MVFRVSIALVLMLVLLAGIAPGPFNTVVQSILGELIRGIGWLYLLVVFLALVFLMYLAFGRFGNLRIGGEDAEPEFSRASWMSMLFAAGMGIGLVSGAQPSRSRISASRPKDWRQRAWTPRVLPCAMCSSIGACTRGPSMR